MPNANLTQDKLRAQIRGGEPRAITGTGRQWLASAESNRLYSYEFDEHNNSLNEPAIYEFDADRGSSGQCYYWRLRALGLPSIEWR